MTNILEQAADILEGGWCTGGMVEAGGEVLKFCSVGGVAAADLGFTRETLDPDDLDVRLRIDAYAWGEAENGEKLEGETLDRNHPALQALVDELLAQDEVEQGEVWDQPWNTVMDWNDDQTDKDKVVRVFRDAAKRL